MAGGFGDEDDIVRKMSRELIDEQPKIGAAVKNLIAMVLGRSISDPSTNLLFGEDLVFTPEIGLACGRCLLQSIQRFELKEPVSWGESHLQPDDQTGDKRLDELLKYKCLYDMTQRMKAQNGWKVSSSFGRSYLKISRSWPSIKSTIVLPPLVHTEMFDYFLRHFESSLLLDANEPLDEMDDNSLVWAVNFYEALKRRQDKRKVEAKKRIALDEKRAARDAEESDWEDSDDEKDGKSDGNKDEVDLNGEVKSENLKGKVSQTSSHDID